MASRLLLALTLGASLVLGGQPRPSSAQQAAEPRLLIFSRTLGFRHDSISAGVAALTDLAASHGLAVDQTEDAAAFSADRLAGYRAVVFLSTTGDVLDASQQAAFQQYVERGGGFVGIHSASDTEYDWPWYGGLVGAYFADHPEVQPAVVNVEESDGSAGANLSTPWLRVDEWYNFRASPRQAGVQVLLTLDEASYSGGSMGPDHPIAWQHAYDGGRAFYTAGGHTSESFAEPLFRAHLWAGIAYAAALSPDGGER
jgi:type 1 glutamine amidotransferase